MAISSCSRGVVVGCAREITAWSDLLHLTKLDIPLQCAIICRFSVGCLGSLCVDVESNVVTRVEKYVRQLGTLDAGRGACRDHGVGLDGGGGGDGGRSPGFHFHLHDTLARRGQSNLPGHGDQQW